MVQASYLLDGRRAHPPRQRAQAATRFQLRFLKGGRSAQEPSRCHARYQHVDFGRNIFTAGFADPNLWTNHVWATDIGLNWYLNFYTKIMLDWQHSDVRQPGVRRRRQVSRRRLDLFWLRFQLFF